MLSFMHGEGLRRVEVSRMLIDDIDQRAASVRLRGKAGQGNTTRVVPLSATTARLYDAYSESEAALLGLRTLASGPVFRNRNDPHLGISADMIGRLVTAALYEIGVKHGPRDGRHPHALRHTMATEALEAGAALPMVQRFLGHQNPGTTHHYTRGAVLDLRQVHELRDKDG
jgi:site-specific recombinase XerD